MYLLLDTSRPECHLYLIDGDKNYHSSWLAERELANGLLGYIGEQLRDKDATLHDLKGIGVFRGPGSFTGLRIGLAVCNTLADSLQIPIVGAVGDNWVDKALDRLRSDERDEIVMPLYDRPANITKPRK